MQDRSLQLPQPRIDPRWYQIAMLSGLLLYGSLALDFGLGALWITTVIGTALLVQYACTHIWKLPAYDPLSALISGIGLCTLIRTEHLWIAALGAAVAIASKFSIRWKGKHLFNPTNFALLLLIVIGEAWISPGQYGGFAFAAFFIVWMGLLVVHRAARGDVTLAFLATWFAILFGRSWWLGEPMSIPLHRVQQGMLLQFAFNMISDPKTTPDSRAGRVLFGCLVALGGGFVQFVLFRTNGLLWSLALASLLVPLIDRLLPGRRYEWSRNPTTPPPSTPKGVFDETPVLEPARVRGALARGRA
jgi:Na+-transporting NADH:ubiquinone oxidoreductase subunit NqrB